MSIKEDLSRLGELSDIRKMRVERAMKALQHAKDEYEIARQEAQKAGVEMREYGAAMPGLIDELYETCLGIAVGKSVVEEVRAKEGKIRSKYLSLQEIEKEAQSHQKAMMAAVKAAHAELIREERRKDGLEEIEWSYEKEYRLQLKKEDGRVLDEFATVQAVTK